MKRETRIFCGGGKHLQLNNNGAENLVAAIYDSAFEDYKGCLEYLDGKFTKAKALKYYDEILAVINFIEMDKAHAAMIKTIIKMTPYDRLQLRYLAETIAFVYEDKYKLYEHDDAAKTILKRWDKKIKDEKKQKEMSKKR